MNKIYSFIYQCFESPGSETQQDVFILSYSYTMFATYRLRFYSISFIHILSLSNSHNNVASIQRSLFKPLSNDPNFLPNNTQHLFIICCMLSHVVLLDSVLPNIVQLYNLLWIVRLKYNCSLRNH